MSGVVVRDMLQEDLGEVFRMEEACFSHPWKEEDIEKALYRTDTVYLIAECEGAVAGYCSVWISFETAELWRIVVKEEYRKQGLGAKMLQEALRRCAEAGTEKMLLEVRASNHAACILYKKNGFQIIGKRKNYYSLPTEDALLLELPCISCVQIKK